MLDQSISITPDPSELVADDAEMLARAEAELREALREAQEAAAARVQYLGTMLQREADERVSLRSEVEERWLKNVRQINGIYEAEDLPPKDPEEFGCRLFMPMTRRLRNMVEARLVDVIFPSDQRFWVLDPSPVAELTEIKGALAKLPGDTMMPEGTQLSAVMTAIEGVQKEAEVKAQRMQRVIDDRLAECRFPAKARRAIGDAIDLGTGVIKGPVPIRRRTRVRRETEAGLRTEIVDKVVQGYEYVPVWNYFPDMTCTDVRDSQSDYELHPLTKQELQALRGQPGFIDAAIDMVLAGDPRIEDKARRADLRKIAGLSQQKDPRYFVWEYNGPIKGADLIACGVTDVEEQGEYQSVVWFCDGIVIKAITQPLESDQPSIYSLIYWQRDKASIFGYGLPDEVRDQQSALNGAFRAMMDNMALSAGPQFVIDEKAIKPVDGKFKIKPRKVWRKTDATKSVRDVFATYDIPSRINELDLLLQRAKGLMDETANVPGFLQGADAPGKVQSATEASINWTAANLWVRRFVRHWDDDIVEPVMTRAMDWEMDYNEDESIKGDYQAVAKGMAALVELEGQSTRMQQFVMLVKELGLQPKDQLRVARTFARTLKLDADEMLPSEEEIQAMAEGQGPSPEQQMADLQVQKVQGDIQNNTMDHEAKMAELQEKAADRQMRGEEYVRRERLALLELASRERMTVEQAAQKYGYDWQKLQAELAESDKQRAHDAQVVNAEVAVKMAKGSGI